jgi:hypothetical protein
MNEGLQRRRREWRDRLIGLREALGELYAAEMAALSRDLERWGKGFLVALLLALGALFLLFWLLAVVVGTVVAALAEWLPVWGAMLVTAGLLLVVIAVLALLAWRRLQRLGGPLALMARRWRDHLDWWQERVLQEPGTEELGNEEDDDAATR